MSAITPFLSTTGSAKGARKYSAECTVTATEEEQIIKNQTNLSLSIGLQQTHVCDSELEHFGKRRTR